MSAAKIHHCAQSSSAPAPRAEGFGFLKPPEVVCSPKQCCLGERHPQGGSSQECCLGACGGETCYLLALTMLQLSRASKRNPAAAARPPIHCPQPGKGTFHGFIALVHGAEPGLLSSLHSQPPQHEVSTLTSNREETWSWPSGGTRHKSCFNLDAGLPLVLDIWFFKTYIPDSSFCFPFTTPALKKRFA